MAHSFGTVEPVRWKNRLWDPIANPIEMGNTHETAVDTVKNIEGYRLQFAKIFPGEGN